MKFLNTFVIFVFALICANADAQNRDSAAVQTLEPALVNVLRDNAEMVTRHKANKLSGKPSVLDTMSVKDRYNVHFNPAGKIDALTVIATLADGEACPKTALEALGCEVTCQVGDIVIIDLPASAVESLGKMKEFKDVKIDRKRKLMNYGARQSTNVAYLNGERSVPGFTTTYDGSGVVVGVIDAGIDFNHVAFRNADGTTRIKEAVHFDSGSNMIVTTGTDIDALTTYDTSTSHGTHTSSTAAGSYAVSDRKLQGMAPGADLVLCDLGSSLWDSRIIEAAEEIFRYAEDNGKPAVINCSLGYNGDFLDGNNSVSLAFNSLTNAKAGCVIAVSAGNEAYDQITISKQLGTADANGYQLKTVIYAPSTKSINDQTVNYYKSGIELLIYSTDAQEFTVELKAVDVTNGSVYSLSDKQLILASSSSATIPTLTRSTDNGRNYYSISINSCYLSEPNLSLGIFIKGSNGQTVNVIDASENGFCGSDSYPSVLADYDEGCGDKSINALACTDGVISVGAYRDRNAWRDYNSGHYYYAPVVNQYPNKSIASFSSYGVDDNDIARPDVLAPGVYINSGYNIYDTSNFDSSTKAVLSSTPYITDYLTGVTLGSYTRAANAYGAMSGTSMACPVTTGVIALWLQADPTLTVSDVRNIIKATSYNDSYTTNADSIPSGNLVQAGAGKIDALKGIEYILNNNGSSEDDVTLGENITISSTQIGTFSSTHALDFSSASAPKAYIASAFDGSTLTFTRVTGAVPANTGLLLLGSAGTHFVPFASSETASVGDNLLHGTADGDEILEAECEAYVLSKKSGKVGFYLNAANLTVKQGKAYLVLPETTPTESNSAKALSFCFDDEETSGDSNMIAIEGGIINELRINNGEADDIESVTTIKDKALVSAPRFNMAGQRVDANYKGIVVCGGKKYLIK